MHEQVFMEDASSDVQIEPRSSSLSTNVMVYFRINYTLKLMFLIV